MEKTGHEILTRQNNAYEQHQPLISVHLMTMDDANPELSRLGMYERRLNDAASIASVFNLEVVSNCGGKFSEATMDKVQRIIDQFSFPIVMTFCDGIVKGRNLTLSNAVGPLSFFWDDDCVLLPDALSVFQVMMEKLKTSDFCAAGVRSVDLDYKHYKPRPGLKPCLAYPELRRLADDEVIDYIGDVIPAGIHGMAFLMYTKPLREVGGFASFLRNQGEWGAVWTELWRQKGLSCVYVLRPEVKILHDHAPFSPNRTMSGRFAESCIYMIFYAYIYGIEPQDPLYKIGQERYLRAWLKLIK